MKTSAGTVLDTQTPNPSQTDFNSHNEPNRTIEILQEPNVLVIIPAFNEERFIGSVVIKATDYANTVVVVDDGSTDGTGQVARLAGALVITHQTNKGKGAALNTGFSAARQFNPDVVVCMDGDGQHKPEEIEQLIRPILYEGIDITIGSRYLDPNCKVPLLRIWGHKVFNLFTRWSSGVAVSDSQCGFRAFSPRTVDAISFCSQDFSVESEMQFLANEHKLKIKEERVTIHYEDPPKRSVFVQGLQVLNGLRRMVGQRRPVIYYGILGSVALLIGLGLGLRVLHIFRINRELAVGSALICVLCTMIGTILITQGLNLDLFRSLLNEFLIKKNGSNN